MDQTPSTDAENETLPFSKVDPEWQVFEKDIAEQLQRLDPGASVEHNTQMVGLVSGTKRQIDVLITGKIAAHPFRIAIECKRYARKLGIGKVDEFVGKLLDLHVDSGILYTFNGLTAPAIERASRAAHPRVLLAKLDTDTMHADLPNWDRLFTGFGDCQNPNCMTGDVLWQGWPQENGVSLEAGACPACGTWAFKCLGCEDYGMLMSQPLPCFSCEGWTYQLLEDHNGGMEIVSTPV